MNSQKQWIPDPNNPTQWILNQNFHPLQVNPPQVNPPQVNPPEVEPHPVVSLPVVTEYLNFHGPGFHCSGPDNCSHISHQAQSGPPYIDLHGPGLHCTGITDCKF